MHKINIDFKLSKNNIFQQSILETIQKKYSFEKTQSFENKKQRANILADFENLRKRNITEKKNSFKIANKDIISSLLKIIDDLENAFKSVTGKNCYYSYVKTDKIFRNIRYGLFLIIKNFIRTLKTYGLIATKSLGTKFNPLHHEAIRNVSNFDIENEVNIKEYQKGYMLDNLLLRASKVVVNIKE